MNKHCESCVSTQMNPKIFCHAVDKMCCAQLDCKKRNCANTYSDLPNDFLLKCTRNVKKVQKKMCDKRRVWIFSSHLSIIIADITRFLPRLFYTKKKFYLSFIFLIFHLHDDIFTVSSLAHFLISVLLFARDCSCYLKHTHIRTIEISLDTFYIPTKYLPSQVIHYYEPVTFQNFVTHSIKTYFIVNL